MELDALEAFALQDRAEALASLVPGTPEHAYFTNLSLQHAGDVEGATRHLLEWVRQHGDSEHARQAKRRLTLLAWEEMGEEAARELRRELGVSFNHQREVEAPPGAWPSQLDAALTDEDALLEPLSSDLSGFTDDALRPLTARIAADLQRDEPRFDRGHRQALLDRLSRPDTPGLLDVIRADLDDPRGASFGGRDIHRALLLTQLDVLAAERLELWESRAFVEAVLEREQPGADVDLEADLDARAEHLDRLYARVAPLSGAFNALKAHALYHRLELDRRRAHLDLERLCAYLALPRQAHYIPTDLTRGLPRDHIARGHTAGFGLAVASDEPLVRDLVSRALVAGEATVETFGRWMERRYLERLEATAHLVAGDDEVERWREQLGDPATYQALVERVDIDLAPTNPTYVGARDAVALEVDLKNVPRLTIKVFEINSLNHFLHTGSDVETDLDLDGLVASAETTHTFDDSPLRRVRRRFELGLTEPGVYIVELIGNGVSSRALIRKGELQIASRLSAAGHVFAVFSDGERVEDARMWLNGRAIKPDEDGLLRLPFTAHPRHTTALFQRGAVTHAHTFQHAAESYHLDADVLLERESLLPEHRAELGLRLQLRVGDVPVSNTLLEDVELVLESVDHDGNTATRTLPITARDDADLHTLPFKVPARLARISATVRARVRCVSRQEHVELTSDAFSQAIAGVLAEHQTASLHLVQTARGYVLQLLGLGGEARPQRRVDLTLRHRLVTRTLSATLQTDEAGRVELGQLPGVTHLSARASGGTRGGWDLEPEDHVTLPTRLQACPSDGPLRLPLPPSSRTLEERVSLLELRDGRFTRDALDGARIEAGDLVLPELAPGDYTLHLRELDHTLRVHILDDDTRRGRWLVSPTRMLERNPRAAVGLARVERSEGALRVQLSRPSKHTRVHLVATRLHPLWATPSELRGDPRAPRAITLERRPSHHISGREIGDELRYILERQHAQPRPGNMLERPSLLLNPWSIRETQTLRDEVEAGEVYARAISTGAKKKRKRGGSRARRRSRAQTPAPSPCLDFLVQPALVRFNLTPDDDGAISIPASDLAPFTTLRVVVTDPRGGLTRQLPLDEPPLARRDLRLLDSLDPDRHVSERKQISPLPEGDAITFSDTRTARVEVYDSLEKVYTLFSALSGGDDLRTFAFLTNWHSFDEDRKRELYGEHACHELHLFLHRKDPDFFQRVARPYITHKLHKTFLDELLLGYDLSRHRTPTALQRLNTAERILLAHATGDDALLRAILDRHDTLPADPEGTSRLIDAALQGSALDEDGGVLPPAPPPPPAESLAIDGLMAKSASGGGGGNAFAALEMDEMSMDAFADEADEDDDLLGHIGGLGGKADLDARARMDPLYRKADTTRAWVETHYHRRRLADTTAALIRPNPFWADFARHTPGDGPFLSPAFIRATSSFTEMVFALALLDLPFEAGEHTRDLSDHSLTLTAASHALVAHEELGAAPEAEETTPILVSQNLFRHDDRYREVGGERVEKYLSGPLLIHTIYACQVVLTNPGSARQKLDLLTQIPRGAIAVGPDSFTTRSRPLSLDPYATRTLEYTFYFPTDGAFTHYPAHVSRNEVHLIAAQPRELEVLRQPRERDETSWAWISQHADTDRLLTFLEREPLAHLDLSRLAWRMHDADTFTAVLERLRARRAFEPTLWSYALMHHDTEATREYLTARQDFIARCGPEIHTPLLTTRAERRVLYEHIEYAPLFNARAHRVGHSRRVLNTDLRDQYRAFLQLLCHRPAIDHDDRVAAVYYLLLQDRVEEALTLFDAIDPLQITARLPFDYLRAYLAFFTDTPEDARAFAEPWLDHPVPRWRDRFRAVLSMLDEARGVDTSEAPTDADSRQQQLDAQSAREPSLDFEVEAGDVLLHHHLVDRAELRFYGMDIELLFSREPFVQQQSSRFSWIQPNHRQSLPLGDAESPLRAPIPEALRDRNVVIEVEGGGRARSLIHYANRLRVRLAEPYGQLRVYDSDTDRPLPRAYVKAYARTLSGEVRFFKDGYTDLRGAFDYSTLSTDELDQVQRFALLVMSDSHGAVILEAEPPG